MTCCRILKPMGAMVGLRKAYMASIVSLLPVKNLGKLTSMQVHTDTLDRLHRASQRGESYEQTEVGM